MTMLKHHDPDGDAATGRLTTPAGVTLSYDRFGSGAHLVLVHGSFTDHRSNWQFVADELARHFTIWALARRGRGETDVIRGHAVEDEAADVVALIRHIDAPVVLLGHSYGAQVALAAAPEVSSRIEKLVLYEPPVKGIVTDAAMTRLEACARDKAWERFTEMFFRDVIAVPAHELEELRGTPLWAQFVADAPYSLHDIHAQMRYDFDARDFTAFARPVILQTGTESPRSLYATDALLEFLPDAREQDLPGQGHDAMLTDPDLYARRVLTALQA